MCSGRSDWALAPPGFPIRISTDQSLVDSSPWLFAATHVLHRHLAPRHPPLALCTLKSHTPRPSSGEEDQGATSFKTLVLAMQFSRIAPKPFSGFEAAVRDVEGTSHLSASSTASVTPVLPS